MISQKFLVGAFAVFLIFSAGTVQAQGDFAQWVEDFKKEALAEGISPDIVNRTLGHIQPIPRVVELDRKQPEGRLTFAEYKKRVINQARIDKGREMMKIHREALAKASAAYGVEPQYIVALWGIETSYGENTGGFEVIPALATLAYDGRRSAFFRSELLKALHILDQGHIAPDKMRGSWAGAMGQNQFMPSSFHAYAVDGNNDGRRDIWTSLPDVFASTANYLSRSGWKNGQRWGRKVNIPQNFPESLAGREISKPLQEWRNMGLSLPGGEAWPVAEGLKASIILPDGKDGPAYMVYDNYGVIMKWNKSIYFATSVGLLADLIARQPV